MAGRGLRLNDVWKSLFPDRRIYDPRDPEVFPKNPFDMFAATGKLLELSGAYHHVMASNADDVRNALIPITAAQRNRASKIGKQWMRSGPLRDPPAAVKKLWLELRKKPHLPVFNMVEGTPPAWWFPAVALFLIADEAAEGLAEEGNVFFDYFQDILPPTTGPYPLFFSLSSASPDVACVMPKQQTPSVGCTMRSLSRNLALLPPRGEATVQWMSTPRAVDGVRRRLSTDADQPLNLLLIPWPYEVAAKAFREADRGGDRSYWRWFEVEKTWLPASEAVFLSFVEGLIDECRRDVGNVHGVIFPELSLSSRLFDSLAEYLHTTDDLEFLIAGVDADQHGATGNYVATALMGFEDDEGRFWLRTERPKHHRWKLSKEQIRQYGLGAALHPDCNWWESIPLPRRILNFFALRRETLLTVMICEDLARVDPCQSILRSLGPNLVIALLMDGPQLQDRWPGRYATILADDPGSSVLTLTSLALIERQNRIGKHPISRTVALWRDEVTGHREIKLADGFDAVCLTLSPSRPRDQTLDGREHERVSWSLSGARSVKSPAPRP